MVFSFVFNPSCLSIWGFQFQRWQKIKHVWITWLLSKDAFPERQYILSCPPNHIYIIITLKNTAAQTLRENATDDFDQTTSKKKKLTQRDVYSTHTTGWMDGMGMCGYRSAYCVRSYINRIFWEVQNLVR
jgi:hypothetical protein